MQAGKPIHGLVRAEDVVGGGVGGAASGGAFLLTGLNVGIGSIFKSSFKAIVITIGASIVAEEIVAAVGGEMLHVSRLATVGAASSEISGTTRVGTRLVTCWTTTDNG